jgi:hypothetical protein
MSESPRDRHVPTDAPTVAPPSGKRRRFLFALGASGAGAAAAIAAPGVTATVVPSAAAAAEGRPGGYRVTDHVRDYYETTRL